ncbi:MAG: putative metallopeptidase [archaeon]
MPIKYYKAPDIEMKAREIVELLGWKHIHLEHVAFIRSQGSKARRTIARCHALGKAMQIGMGRKKGFYLIEVIAEKFDKLKKEDQVKTIIHELMHIPKTFGGGFVHHNKVHDGSVENIYQKYTSLKNEKFNIEWY